MSQYLIIWIWVQVAIAGMSFVHVLIDMEACELKDFWVPSVFVISSIITAVLAFSQ